MLFLATCLHTKGQELKLSSDLIGYTWVCYANGYKRLAQQDRGAMLEYERKLKIYAWSLNATVGNSRINFNRYVDSLSCDVHSSVYFFHFYPLGIKKYYRISGRSSFYIEFMAGLDYLYKFIQTPEREDLRKLVKRDMGFSVGASAKSAFKVIIDGRSSFDIGIHITDEIFSKLYLDVGKNQKVGFESSAIFITFYRSIKKKNEKVPRIPFTDN